MFETLRKRLQGDERGFTLIELVVVIMILGILVAIAVPSYLSFRSKANDAAAQANVRAIVPSIGSYFSDNGTYVGMTLASLKTTYDQAIGVTKYALPNGDLSASTYCVSSTVNARTWRKNGPAAPLENSACP